MKICVCVNGRAHEGGVTSYINSICDGLRSFGHQVDVVTLFGISKYRETKNLIIQKTDKLLLGSPIKTIVFYILSKTIIGIRLLIYYPFKKWDIIFAQDASVAKVACVLKIIFGVPVILMVHGSIPLALLHQGKIKKNDFVWNLLIKEERVAFAKSNIVIANSNHTAEYIGSVCPERKNIKIIRNLVNEKLFFKDPKINIEERKKLKILPDEFVILFVGRLTTAKGPTLLLDAFEKIIGEPKLTLVFAGDGPERINLEKTIKERGLEEKVKILGNIPYNEMGKVYNIANVLVVPSITLGEVQEPLGIVALEGMATEIPVIAFAVGGLKEIIKNGYNGILIPEKDTPKLAQSILEIRKNSALAQKLIQNGKKEITEKYTTRVVAQKLINIFNSCISK